jgi:polyphosphate kinase
MQRNLDRRVETLFPLEDPKIVEHMVDDLLMTYLQDNVRARILQPDGRYIRLQPEEGAEPIDSQAVFSVGRDVPPEMIGLVVL